MAYQIILTFYDGCPKETVQQIADMDPVFDGVVRAEITSTRSKSTERRDLLAALKPFSECADRIATSMGITGLNLLDFDRAKKVYNEYCPEGAKRKKAEAAKRVRRTKERCHPLD